MTIHHHKLSRRTLLQAAAALGSAGVLARPALAQAQASLVLGDQAGGLRALFEASGTLEGAPFAWRWANFQGAAPLFEAHRSGAVDTAMAGDLPVLAAAVGRTPLKIVATRVGKPDSLGIVVQADSKIRSVAELRGQTVIVSSARGSISQYQLHGALEEAGVKRDEVTIRFVLPTDAAAAFASKQIEAWAVFDPYYTVALQQGGRVLRDGRGISTGLGLITASEAALADPARRAAIVQFLDRLARAGDWALANPEAYAQAYTQLTRLPIEASRIITARSAVAGRPVSEGDIVALQTVADRSARDGILPVRIDVRAITDAGLWPAVCVSPPGRPKGEYGGAQHEGTPARTAIAPLRDFVTAFGQLLDTHPDEGRTLRDGGALLRSLVAREGWLPDAFAQPDPARYRQYLLHADAAGRFSVVSFVWGPGQATPVHDHTVWGLIGMLRGAEFSQGYANHGDRLHPRGDEVRLDAGAVGAVSPTIGDVHRVRNAFDDRVSISIHVYGADIGTVRRHAYSEDGGSKSFVSGYSNTVLPKLGDSSTEGPSHA